MDKYSILLLFKILTPLLILPIIGFFLYKIIEKNKKIRRLKLDNYLESNISKKKKNGKNPTENLTSKIEEILFPFKVNSIVSSKLSEGVGIGLITFIPSMLISFVGAHYFPVLGFVFPINILVLIILVFMFSKSKKNEFEYLSIATDVLKILDNNKIEILHLIPADIKRLSLYETMGYNKGIPRIVGSIIELEIKNVNQYHITSIKINQYWSQTKRVKNKNEIKTKLIWNERHPIKGFIPIQSLDNKKLLRKEIIDFCIRNNIEVKNSI
jgi:hypothetical protein